MRNASRVLVALLVTFALLSAAPADAAHKHRRHGHHKVKHHKAHKVKVAKPAPKQAAAVVQSPPNDTIPVLPGLGKCQMFNAKYIPELDGWYYVCG